MDWVFIAGGRCLGQPWRIGVAGIALDAPEQLFAISDTNWQWLERQLPWPELKAYSDANGLLFERYQANSDQGCDALLLVSLEQGDQPSIALDSSVRCYLMLLEDGQQLAPEQEPNFARIFVPADEPFNNERWVRLNQPLVLSDARQEPSSTVGRAAILGRDGISDADKALFAYCESEQELSGWLPDQWQSCLARGVVPVHLGDWDLPEWLPEDVYIDGRRFADHESLEQFLDELDPRDGQGLFSRLQDFLTGPQVYPHSVDSWINSLTAAIAADVAQVRGEAPLLSVIIPTFNHGRFLGQAVRSVLDQGVSSIEVLVLDNASSDDTQDVMRSFSGEPRVRYMRNRRNIGPSHNVLNGIRVATGEYVSMLMADDFFNPGHLTALLPLMQTNPSVAVAYTPIRWVDEQGTELKAPRHPGYKNQDYLGGRNEVADLLVYDNYIAPSATLLRRSSLLQTWRRDPLLHGAGDWLAMIQLAERFPDFAFVTTPGASYRLHGSQHSKTFYASAAPLEDHARIIDGIFERGSEALLKGRALDVAAHLRSRLTRYPQEQTTALGDRVRALCAQLEKLAAPDHGPLFSIILTTFNRPAMLLDALASLAAQTLSDFEVVLINDHGAPVESSLDSFDFPLTYVYKGTNQGLSAARNTGLALARGRYVCYLDDDDMYLPDHLAVLAKAFEVQPGAVVYTGVEYVTEEVVASERRVLKRSEPFRHEQFDKERLFIHNYIPVNTWAHPRELIKDAGEFDTDLTAFEDWDMLLRMAGLRPFLHVPQVTAQVRLREGQGSESDHMQGREREKFAGLYQEMYRRYSDLGSERVREGRSVQLRSLGVATKADPMPVRTWLSARTLTPVQQRLVTDYTQQHEATAAQLLAVIVDLEGDPATVNLSLHSLQLEIELSNISPLVLSAAMPPAGHDGHWHQVDEHTWVDALNRLLASVEADWVMLLKAGDEFTSSGLQMMSLELQTNPDCRAIYADGLYRQEESDYGLALRPDFNLDYLLSFPQGMSQHWLFNRENLVSLGGFDAQLGEAMELDLILRMVNQHGLTGLGHVPEPLVLSQAPVLRDSERERSVIKTHLEERGYLEARVNSILPGQYQIDYGHVDKPLVSIVIVVSDELAAAQRCVMSVLENTTYAPYEILLIDNASRDSATLEWFSALEQMDTALVKVLRSGERLSQSDATNQAALNADGDYLFLLDPDVAVINKTWLDELMNHAQRPEVGVMGACTVNADGKITHAGLVLGLQGPAGEVFLGEPLGAPGYMQRLQLDRNVSAVSGSCLLIRKSLYIDLGGMDTATFADQGAALDLCLRVSDSGHMMVWTPRATLLHSTPKKRMDVETEDALYERWLPRLARDPAYNPSFSLAKPGGFKLAAPQLSWRPLDVWRPQPVVLAHPADLYGCGHYRVIQPFNALLGAGLVDGALSQGLMHVTDLERYAPDVVLLQRQIGDDRLEAMRRMKAFSSAFKVYELDDYLPNLPMKNAHRNAMPKDIVKSLKRGLSFVDRFVVATDSLADAFSGFHDDIQVVQNRLDPLWWGNLPPSARGTSSKPRVGWAGGASHTGDLELIFDLVKDLADEVEWVFLGMCPEKLRPYVHEFHEGVPIDRYPRKLASLNLDLALAPVEENLFNECKSNLRLLEYGACAYPVICSDVRCYVGTLPVTRVKNRYRDWMEAVRSHLADPVASAAQGHDLHRAVKADWMLAGDGLEQWRRTWLP